VNSNAILHIEGLHCTFTTENRKVEALKGISLNVEKGKTLAIVGESGSGKSVTSLSVLRLLNEKTALLKGSILFKEGLKEVDLFKLSDKEMRKIRGNKIAMIFQEPMTSLNPVIKCGEQVAESLRLHKKLNRSEAKKKVIELFNKVKLPRPEYMYSAYPHQLSGGQKQRVMIAMAIACNPEILIADEPTTALDVTVQKNILELLRELQAELRMSIIFITHDLGVVAGLAHNVAVMYNGEIVEQGDVKAIFSQPKHPYTKGLISCRPSLDTRYKKLPVVSDFLGDTTFTYSTVSNQERKENQDKIYSQAPLLEIKNLSKVYELKKPGWGFSKEKLVAVNDVSLNLYPGETLGLVGESGCGKSTLGKLILQLIKPTKGKIEYNGQDLAQLSSEDLRRMRRKIQVIFQDPYSSLNPIQRIGDAISEPMIVHGIYRTKTECKEAAIELLEKVGLLPEHYDRYPHEFSGGQRQRIVIARALSLNPEFIVCDECVSALDVSVQAQIINLLQDLKEQNNLSYIFISHDLSVVKYMSDRIAVMQQGKIVELNDADAVYSHPQSAYTQQLIEAIPALPAL